MLSSVHTINTTVFDLVGGSSSGNSLSDGAVTAIACVVTFIVTLIATAIISSVVTYMIVKRKYSKMLQGKHSITSTDKVLYEPVSSPSRTANDMELQKNPAYGPSGKVIMDNNPAYESYKH